ncbi:hypothetical protein [Candidatus Methylacidithermus pantelleriae]|uniref:Rod shape-determining protein MreC n=1 Tax=Candidatus Methylacidithermus pantelleriae TaxID=2744239 RepID=A0A8J2FNP6_9BACT|nr:hypothetical protein [Candidatus Methylacidithermus pantelleriae]CAF0697282.1 Rod shape-determining protein MreC [Candidatus Methylacidithermus pantelleriae]
MQPAVFVARLLSGSIVDSVIDWRMAADLTAQRLADSQQAVIAPGETIALGKVTGFSSPEKAARSSWWLRRYLHWTCRNFSSRPKLLLGGDVIVLSAPKSGRTWIRTFLCAYLCKC